MSTGLNERSKEPIVCCLEKQYLTRPEAAVVRSTENVPSLVQRISGVNAGQIMLGAVTPQP
jgi:hypothetical protein